MTTLQRRILVFVAPGVMCAQISTPRPEFEVAAIKPSAPAVRGKINDLGLRIDSTGVTSTYFTLKDYIRIAWRVRDYQIAGPEWLSSERFDVAAKIPSGSTTEQIPEMIQALLKTRFGLIMHRETRDLAALALVPAKSGSKLKLSAPDDGAANGTMSIAEVEAASGVLGDLGNGAIYSIDMERFRVEAKKYPLSGLSDLLSRFTGRPVVDATGLSGGYDMTLQFQADDFSTITNRWAVARGIIISQGALQRLESEGDLSASISGALRPLGLELVERKSPVEMLIVDRMEKVPTEN